jgi:hypothetical protein
MRSVLAVLVALVCIGSAASAQTSAPTLSGPVGAGAVQAPAPPPAKATKRGRKGRAQRVAVADKGQERPRGASTVEEALSSCLLLWEPATHMTKRQWARACRRVAERLRQAG